MAKSLFYRLFGLGKVPKRFRPELEREGIVLIDEGVSGALVFKKFKAPSRYYGRRYSGMAGSLVVTGKRFVAFTFYPFFNPVLDVELDDERLRALECSVPKESKLHIRFDASLFRDDWSGSIECRYSTPKARLFLERLQR